MGVINHAHMYDNGMIAEHMHCHVYHEGEGKNGANNVATLIVKTLEQSNILRDDLTGGESKQEQYSVVTCSMDQAHRVFQ